MVRHIIMFKLKDFSDPSEKLEMAIKVKNELEKLKEKIEVIKFLEVGINVEPLPFAYDIVLNTDFETMEDLNAYRIHPAHKAFIEFNKDFSVSKVSVDFITNHKNSLS